MQKEKAKNDLAPRRTFKQGLLVGALIGAALMAICGWLGLSLSGPTGHLPAETLIVPFNKAEITWTTASYDSCYVDLKIEGTGQAAGSDYSDSFYQYTQNGQPLETPLTHQFDLEIDGDRAIITLGLEDNPPPYNPEHIYNVIYHSGREMRRIGFRISDLNVGDNTGQFLIRVSQGLCGG